MKPDGKTPFQICVLTTTRADYGILRPLLFALHRDPEIDLHIAVTGTHLLESFGMTVEEIENDHLPISVKIPILEGENRSPASMSRTMGRALERFGEYFQSHLPDLLVVLGDRFETFAICAAAVNACIPIAHLHGGEATEGLMDECFRHSITKMSYLHFTAAEVYRKRVIQLGEDPRRVFNVGALSVENALHAASLEPAQMEEYLGFSLFQKPVVVVTYHSVTLETGSFTAHTRELLSAIEMRPDLHFLITKSNLDIGGQEINKMLEDFAETHPHCCVVASLGMVRYMSVLKHAVCVLGNSSSGIVEAPSFGIPTVNIGDRQRGRLQAESIINCPPDCNAILDALELALSEDFRQKAASIKSPFGDGNTSGRIRNIIKDTLFLGTIDLKKTFYDIPFEV